MSTPLHGPLDHWRTVYTICGHGIGQGLVFQKHSLQEQKMLRFHLSWGGPFSFLSFNGCCIIPVVFSPQNLYSARIPETDESDLPDGVRSTLLSQQHWDKPWQENIHGGRREMVKCTRCQHVKWTQTERFYLERATGRSSVECISPIFSVPLFLYCVLISHCLYEHLFRWRYVLDGEGDGQGWILRGFVRIAGILRCHSLEWWTSWIYVRAQTKDSDDMSGARRSLKLRECLPSPVLYVTIWTKRTKCLVLKKLQPRSLGYVGWDKTASSWGMYTCT